MEAMAFVEGEGAGVGSLWARSDGVERRRRRARPLDEIRRVGTRRVQGFSPS